MLVGESVVLRSLKIEDLERTHKWRNNSDSIKLTLGVRFPKSLEMDKEWFMYTLNDKSNRNIYFGIDELKTNLFIGIIQIVNIDWISRVADFGINIGEKDKTGQGFGKESMRLLFDYAFYKLNLRKINLKVVSFNLNAIKAYNSIGFIEEGTLKEQVYFNDEYFDVVLMGLFKRDFLTHTQQKHK